jgi:hypothetical protein
MSKRPLEARPDRRMASGALRIAGTPDISRVNAMAAVAGDSVPRVGRLKAARLNLVGFVAAQARSIHRVDLTACEDRQLIRIQRLDMR